MSVPLTKLLTINPRDSMSNDEATEVTRQLLRVFQTSLSPNKLHPLQNLFRAVVKHYDLPYMWSDTYSKKHIPFLVAIEGLVRENGGVPYIVPSNTEVDTSKKVIVGEEGCCGCFGGSKEEKSAVVFRDRRDAIRRNDELWSRLQSRQSTTSALDSTVLVCGVCITKNPEIDDVFDVVCECTNGMFVRDKRDQGRGRDNDTRGSIAIASALGSGGDQIKAANALMLSNITRQALSRKEMGDDKTSVETRAGLRQNAPRQVCAVLKSVDEGDSGSSNNNSSTPPRVSAVEDDFEVPISSTNTYEVNQPQSPLKFKATQSAQNAKQPAVASQQRGRTLGDEVYVSPTRGVAIKVEGSVNVLEPTFNVVQSLKVVPRAPSPLRSRLVKELELKIDQREGKGQRDRDDLVSEGGRSDVVEERGMTDADKKPVVAGNKVTSLKVKQ
eukprot:GDKJ01027003.1.p1 GENE.GDKJ01027003.1~~GDKJ01027003.1.p1  ORF type:complete len:441 (-),score=121.56 GDKJ01027003.1:517-1839(-)